MPNDVRRPMTRHPALATVATLVLAAAPLVNISGLSGAPEQTAPRIVKITGGQHKLLLRSDGTVAGWNRDGSTKETLSNRTCGTEKLP
jgi:hypothetical protein